MCAWRPSLSWLRTINTYYAKIPVSLVCWEQSSSHSRCMPIWGWILINEIASVNFIASLAPMCNRHSCHIYCLVSLKQIVPNVVNDKVSASRLHWWALKCISWSWNCLVFCPFLSVSKVVPKWFAKVLTYLLTCHFVFIILEFPFFAHCLKKYVIDKH